MTVKELIRKLTIFADAYGKDFPVVITNERENICHDIKEMAICRMNPSAGNKIIGLAIAGFKHKSTFDVEEDLHG